MAVSSTLGPPKLHVSIGAPSIQPCQENAASPAEMDVDDEVAPLLPLLEKEESHSPGGIPGASGCHLDIS